MTDLEVDESARELAQRLEIHRRILANRSMRASSRLDAEDSVRREHSTPGEELSIFARIDVVGDDGKLVLRMHAAAQPFDQRGFARADRTTDSNLEGFWNHDLKSRASMAACRIEAISRAGTNPAIS